MLTPQKMLLPKSIDLDKKKIAAQKIAVNSGYYVLPAINSGHYVLPAINSGHCLLPTMNSVHYV